MGAAPVFQKTGAIPGAIQGTIPGAVPDIVEAFRAEDDSDDEKRKKKGGVLDTKDDYFGDDEDDEDAHATNPGIPMRTMNAPPPPFVPKETTGTIPQIPD